MLAAAHHLVGATSNLATCVVWQLFVITIISTGPGIALQAANLTLDSPHPLPFLISLVFSYLSTTSTVTWAHYTTPASPNSTPRAGPEQHVWYVSELRAGGLGRFLGRNQTWRWGCRLSNAFGA